MARTTPAQKPRGWANITFIKTSGFGHRFGFEFAVNLRPDPRAVGHWAAGRRGYSGLCKSRWAGAVALLTHSFQALISIALISAAHPGHGPCRLEKPNTGKRITYKPHH